MFQPKRYWLKYTSQDLHFSINYFIRFHARAFKTLRRFFSTLHVLDSPLCSNSWFSAHNWTSSFRSACCLDHLRSKKIASLKPSLQIAASNQIQRTSHKNLNKNAAHYDFNHLPLGVQKHLKTVTYSIWSLFSCKLVCVIHRIFLATLMFNDSSRLSLWPLAKHNCIVSSAHVDSNEARLFNLVSIIRNGSTLNHVDGTSLDVIMTFWEWPFHTKYPLHR